MIDAESYVVVCQRLITDYAENKKIDNLFYLAKKGFLLPDKQIIENYPYNNIPDDV